MPLVTAVFDPGVFLKKFIRSFEKVVGEFHWQCKKDGLCYFGMDASQVAMVGFELAGDVFQQYSFEESDGGILMLGIKVSSFLALLKSMPDDAPIKLDVWEEHGPLHISSKGEGVKWSSRLKLLDLDREYLNPPADDIFIVNIKMPSKVFLNTMKDTAVLGGKTLILTLKTKEDSTGQCMVLESDSTSMGQIFNTINGGEGGVSSWEDFSLRQAYDLKFVIENILPFCGLSETLHLQLGLNKTAPMKVSFPINEESKVVFYLGQKHVLETPVDDAETVGDVEMG